MIVRAWLLAGAASALALVCCGCGGGAPLLHPAHTLHPGDVTMGAGMSGRVALLPADVPAGEDAEQALAGATSLEDLTVAPAIAPWVSARIGLDETNEGGLTYTGRAVRLDARHAFSLGTPTLSVGLGASAISARRPGNSPDDRSVLGGGLDVPVIIGVTSTADIYSLWGGVRGGFELFRGGIASSAGAPGADPIVEELSGRHFFAGFVAGLRVGFRHVHVGLEIDGAYHIASGSIGDRAVRIEQLSLTPGGALIVSF
jgi:hypothetical protein